MNQLHNTISPERGPSSSLLMKAVKDVALTILAHPDVTRVGARFRLPFGRTELSRVEPAFLDMDGQWRAIEDLFISRSPITLELLQDGSVLLDPHGSKIETYLNSQLVTERVSLSRERIEDGTAITLGKRVVLWMQHTGPETERGDDLGLVGRSEGIAQVRRDVLQVSDLDVPVLVRGETGTGKELVARAIHRLSRRRGRACEIVNMAAIPGSLAASELFGHRRGAFSGADRKRDGAFERADGGTLFLDEVGDTPAEVQPLLLRALESGEIQPLGADGVKVVDVRLIAATDVDLEHGSFRKPLLHRLSSYQIYLPPLRRRREDIGLLFHHFVREALTTIGQPELLAGDPQQPWVPAALLVSLVRHSWPGNVRQLRNVAQQLVIASRGLPRMRYRDLLDRILSGRPSLPGSPSPVRSTTTRPAPGSEQPSTLRAEASERAPLPEAMAPRDASPRPAKVPYRKPSEVGEEELMTALRQNGFRMNPTAKELNVSRTTLYALVEACPRIRKGSELEAEEIHEALRASGHDLVKAATLLEVSEHALKLRMGALGI